MRKARLGGWLGARLVGLVWQAREHEACACHRHRRAWAQPRRPRDCRRLRSNRRLRHCRPGHCPPGHCPPGPCRFPRKPRLRRSHAGARECARAACPGPDHPRAHRTRGRVSQPGCTTLTALAPPGRECARPLAGGLRKRAQAGKRGRGHPHTETEKRQEKGQNQSLRHSHGGKQKRPAFASLSCICLNTELRTRALKLWYRAPEGIRTPNLLIRSQMLYPLSYGRPVFRLRD
ncbi:conserved hypothetical protein [Pseudoclavibacter sp. 8L]|nr:conserved hypothetical protein [Pseudoclavibacter sp. 8L]